MTRANLTAIVVAAAVAAISGAAPALAQDTSNLAGRWTLDRALTQAPREVGFSADWMMAGASEGAGATSGGGGGRGRRGSSAGSAGAFPTRRESPDDGKRMQQLTAEVRAPSAHLSIAETPTTVTITDDQGHARTFHPDGKEEELRLGDTPLLTTAKWETAHLVVLYQVEDGRQLRYIYSTTTDPSRLIVDIKFLERGGGDEVRRTYEPADPNERPAAAAVSSATAKPGAGSPAAAGAADSGQSAASGDHPIFAQQPGAELIGLTTLGVVVEELSSQAAACGLNQSTIETAVSKSLSDAGLKVLRNSDEDSYVYVDIVTTSLPSGLCVSRYDATLYTHTTARLSYQETPVLVQVSLLHQGGLAGGSPAAHAASVLQGVKQYVDQFVMQIRSANK